jgi:large subunit ribosomal protein L17
MLSNMAASLFLHRSITTTLPKSKAIRPFVDKLATLAKRGDFNARRLAAAKLRDPKAIKTLFDEHAPHWTERTSGFTRIVRIGQRKGDGALLAQVELLVPVPEVADDDGKSGEKADKKTAGKAAKAKG